MLSHLKSVNFICKAVAITLLSLLASSCQWMKEDFDCEKDISSATRYINITISVSSNQTPVTRAPQGGENGDGREAGFERENTVSGITVILYKGTGLDDATAQVDFVHYFTVSLAERDNWGTNYSYDATTGQYDYEALYTTGDQELAEDELDFGATYHVLIVANKDLSSTFPIGTPISTVRDARETNICTSLYTEHPYNCNGFLMTSERDATINFTQTPLLPKANSNYGMVYHVLEPLLIERMSARIDYCTKGGTYDATLGGYKYEVGTTGDLFVVTKVTPFNLNNGEEYLFKHVRSNWTDNVPTINYLSDETTTNFVVDPNTNGKDNLTTPDYYISPIAQDMSGNGYYPQVMTNCQPPSSGSTISSNGQTFIDDTGENNIIIGYAKENTLRPNSYLMKYATGIAFEGYYYANGSSTGQKLVYYYFLRHQGEKSSGSYQAKQWADLSAEEKGTVAMNFGVVRNNIYRVSINQINVVEGTIKLKIEEKHWRHVDNPTIYI